MASQSSRILPRKTDHVLRSTCLNSGENSRAGSLGASKPICLACVCSVCGGALFVHSRLPSSQFSFIHKENSKLKVKIESGAFGTLGGSHS